MAMGEPRRVLTDMDTLAVFNTLVPLESLPVCECLTLDTHARDLGLEWILVKSFISNVAIGKYNREVACGTNSRETDEDTQTTED